MKPSTTKIILISLALALFLSATGCTSTSGQTAGQYNIDDSTITTSVKAKLVADKAANFTRIDVETTNRVVSLTGVVSRPTKKRAPSNYVSGVRRVDNNLQIQKTN